MEIRNNKDIAILMGVYNAEKYISEQIESIINQSNSDWTLYIRDDASSDQTPKLISHFSKINANIIIISDEDGNLGCNGNYFRLLSLIDSKYYMFCNADDFWLPNKIDLCLKSMLEAEKSNFKGPIIIHTDLSITDSKLNILQKSLWLSTNVNPERFKNKNYIGICNIVAGATMFFNVDVKTITFPVHSNAPFFDHWMAFKVLQNGGKIISIPISTMYYRQIGTNLAAVLLESEDTIKHKLIHIKNTFERNKKEALMLRAIGWGGIIKYLFYKLIIFSSLRIKRRKQI